FAIKKVLDAIQDHNAKVIFVAGEDAKGIKSRLRVNCAARGLTVADVAGNLTLIKHAPQLRDPKPVDAAIEAWRDTNPDLIVIDTLSKSALGEDLNSPAVGTAVMGAAEKFAMVLGCHVVLVHHRTGIKGTEAANSKYFMNNADAALMLTHRS